jgi:hypothetical protein
VRQRKRLGDPAWSKNLARTNAPCTGTGRSPGRLKAPLGCRSAPGRRGAVVTDARSGEVRLCRSSGEVAEQSRVTGSGGGGANGRDLGERGTAKHAPAQTRERVTQALNRVRQAARQRKKERFTALLHHVNVDTLGTAFYALNLECVRQCVYALPCQASCDLSREPPDGCAPEDRHCAPGRCDLSAPLSVEPPPRSGAVAGALRSHGVPSPVVTLAAAFTQERLIESTDFFHVTKPARLNCTRSASRAPVNIHRMRCLLLCRCSWGGG